MFVMTSPNEFFPFTRVRRDYGNCLWKLYEIILSMFPVYGDNRDFFKCYFCSMGVMGISFNAVSGLWAYGNFFNCRFSSMRVMGLSLKVISSIWHYGNFFKCFFWSMGVKRISLNAVSDLWELWNFFNAISGLWGL